MHNTVAVQVSNPFAHLHNDEKSHARTHKRYVRGALSWRRGPRAYLVGEALHEVLGQGVRGASPVFVHKLFEIGVQKLKHQVENGLVLLLDVLDCEELDDVRALAQHLENGNLSPTAAPRTHEMKRKRKKKKKKKNSALV